MKKNRAVVYRNMIHRAIIVDFVINVLFFLTEIMYTYRLIYNFNVADERIIGAIVILLFITILFLVYDIIYFYQNFVGKESFGISRIMAISSIINKGIALSIALVITCFIGPAKFISLVQTLFYVSK